MSNDNAALNTDGSSHEVETTGRKIDLLDISEIVGLTQTHGTYSEANLQLPLFTIPSFHCTGGWLFASGPSWIQDVSQVNPESHFMTFNPSIFMFSHAAANAKNFLTFHIVLQ